MDKLRKKGRFIANTGRKSKNTEDVCFFTKGRARDLRPDAKKDKQYLTTHETVEFNEYIPGSTTIRYLDMGGMGTSSETSIEPVDVKIKISVLKEDVPKAKDLLEAGWDNAVLDSFENSPLDIDYGGDYTLDQLFDMPVQEYILKYIDKCGLSFDDISNGEVKHFMSGAAGMLPTVFDVSPPSKKIHQAEKPVALLEQILRFVTKEDELVLDQFAGSGVLGEAALKTGRNSILIEKDLDTYNKMRERISALGDVEFITPEQHEAINVAVDALESIHEGAAQTKAFAEYQNSYGMSLSDASQILADIPVSSDDKSLLDAMDAARKAIDSVSFHNEFVVDKEHPVPEKKILECSSRGDRRFSALFANVTIKGKEQSIEVWYQNAKRTADGKRAGKGKPFDHIVCPFTGDQLPSSEAANLYKGLWITYLSKHPELVEYASGFDELTDMFRSPNTVNCQADVIAAYVKDPDSFVAEVRASFWYQNMASKKKPPLSQQIQSAKNRTDNVHSTSGQEAILFR